MKTPDDHMDSTLKPASTTKLDEQIKILGQLNAERELNPEAWDAKVPSTLKQRLQAAVTDLSLRRGKAVTQTELAAVCEVTEAAVSGWFTGKTQSLQGSSLARAAEFLGVMSMWLAAGTDAVPVRTTEFEDEAGKYVLIPRMKDQAGAGNGIEAREHVEVQSTLAFRSEWLNKKNLNSKHLQLYEAKGNSMSPYLEDGDVILIDTASLIPTHNEIWVICQPLPAGVRVKRLLFRDNGDMIIRSDNPDRVVYPDEIIPQSEINRVRIIGKLAWRGG